MSESATIARPYAEAVFSLAPDAPSRIRWSETLQFAAALVASSELAGLIGDPRIPGTRLLSLLRDIGGRRFDDQALAFLRLLLNNDRLLLLPEIGRAFEDLRRQSENVVDVQIVSARPLAASEEADIRGRLEQRFQHRVAVRARVDESLLAGAVIHIGDRIIDGSLRARLAALATYLNQ